MSGVPDVGLGLKVVLVASGGAVGALLRVGLATLVAGSLGQVFWGTLCVNLIGSFLMGVLRGLGDLHDWGTPAIRLWCAAGVLSAFTTFASFEMDAATLWQQGQRAVAVGYVVGSVLLGLGAYALGWWLVARWK